MARAFTREQAVQNTAFLDALRQSGNIRLAARQVGLKYGTVQHRRAVDPVLAGRIDAAIVFAQAALDTRGGAARPVVRPDSDDVRRTAGGEPVVIRRSDGTLQMRAAQPGKLTRACEQGFLAALSATANVRLSAAAVGASTRAFYRRKRQNPGFAREWQLALEMGYDRIEAELLEGWTPEAHRDDAWRHNDPPPIPPMTPAQALQLLFLHHKEARLQDEPWHLRRRRGEPREVHTYRLRMMNAAAEQRQRDLFTIAETERRAAGRPWVFGPKELPPLPDLAQVTGWSTADPSKGPYDPELALFGGWRVQQMKAKMRAGGR